MQLFRQGEHRGAPHGSGDRSVQMGQMSVPGQLGLRPSVGLQSVALQLFGDGFHHQLMLTPVFV